MEICSGKEIKIKKLGGKWIPRAKEIYLRGILSTGAIGSPILAYVSPLVWLLKDHVSHAYKPLVRNTVPYIFRRFRQLVKID